MGEGIRAMADEFNRECMTGVKDPGIGNELAYDPAEALQTWNAYREALAAGELPVRVFVLWNSPQNVADAKKLIALIEPFGKPAAGAGDDRLVSGGIKIFSDGSGGARTAWMWQDWNRERTGIDAGNRGYPAFDPAVIRELIFLYHDAGLHVGTHAIGDRAIDWVVDSYAEALKRKPVKGLRHSIIHANIPSDRALASMAAMQAEFDAAIPEPSPSFTWWFGDTYAANFGPERSLRLNPFATFEKRGIRWASGSDYFVTPFPARYGIWAATAREPLSGLSGGDPFGRAEAVDAHAALRSFTISAARQVFMDAEHRIARARQARRRRGLGHGLLRGASLGHQGRGLPHDDLRRRRRLPQRSIPVTGEAQIHPGEVDEFAFHAADNPLPEAVDVAIVGGGIIGSSAAYYLAKQGVSAAVFEKGRIGGEQSGRNWGWVRQQCRSPVELPLMMESLGLWKALPEALGEDLGFRQGGTLYLAEDEDGARGAGEVARRRTRARARHAHRARVGTHGAVQCGRAMGRRAVHGERRASRTLACRARDRARGAGRAVRAS